MDNNITQPPVQGNVLDMTAPGIDKPKSSAQALKERLEWGEPGFTIVDVRDREAFNHSRIMGAIPMPLNDPETAEVTKNSLEARREIYIYGDSEEQAQAAANQLRSEGYHEVTELQGGLAAWQAIGGPVEGTEQRGEKVVGEGAYNIVDRLEENAEVQEKFD